MRIRILVGVLLVAGLFTTGSVASARYTAGDRQWTVVNFPDPVLVQDKFVMGPVLIVHDDSKMARGEACTTFYRFETGVGPREEIVSFHCVPAKAQVVDNTTFTLKPSADLGCKRLIAYQIGGDTEVHAIPEK